MEACVNRARNKLSKVEAKEASVKFKVGLATKEKEKISAVCNTKNMEHKGLKEGGLAANVLVELEGFPLAHGTIGNAGALIAKVLIDTNLFGGVEITVQIIDDPSTKHKEVLGALRALVKFGWTCKSCFVGCACFLPNPTSNLFLSPRSLSKL